MKLLKVFRGVSLDNLLDAIAEGNTEKIKSIVQQNRETLKERSNKGFALERQHLDSVTALHAAVVLNQENACRLLVQLGADVNAIAMTSRGFDELTPLHVAVIDNKPNMCAVLMELGANVDACARDKLTPLHLAVCTGNENMCRILVNAGVSKEALSKWSAYENVTALHVAALIDKENICRILVEGGCSMAAPAKSRLGSERLYDNLTPLHLAVMENKPSAVGALVTLGADLNARAQARYSYGTGLTPADLARQYKRHQFIRLLEQPNSSSSNQIASPQAIQVGVSAPVAAAPHAEASYLARGETTDDPSWAMTLSRALKEQPLAPSFLEACRGFDSEIPWSRLSQKLSEEEAKLVPTLQQMGQQYPWDYAIAICAYTLDDPKVYRFVNEVMYSSSRNQGAAGISPALSKWLPYIKFLDTALTALDSQFVYAGECFRGVKWVFPSVENHNPEQYFFRGREFYWYDFKSASRSREVMSNENFCGHESGPRTIFLINAIRAYRIQPFSKFAVEDEVLFRPLSKFRVVSAARVWVPGPKNHPDFVILDQCE